MNRHAIRRGITVALVVVGLYGVAAGQAWLQTAASGEDSLRAVTLLFRHSIVSPKYTAAKVKADWPMGLRQLTALGIREMYDTGQALRQRYVEELGFISGSYRPSEIYVRGSNTDRSLQSAQLLMLGLFPLGTGPDPGIYGRSLEPAPAAGLAFNPVPVHSVALEDDWVLRPYTGKANCKRYKKFVKALPKTKLYRKQGDKYRDILRLASTATGMYENEDPNKILYAINEIYEVLAASVQHNFPIPPEISEQDLQRIGELSDWNYHNQFLGKGVGRLMGGGFLSELVGNFTALTEGDPRGRKFSLYAGHQRTVLGVEAALGIETARTTGPLFKGRVPPPATYYAFELHEPTEGSFAVRLKFNAKDGERIIPVPGCQGQMCTFDEFAGLASEMVPRNWREACKG
ncbi:MAG: histidine-type phosphatase [Planctomycetota bacterium]